MLQFEIEPGTFPESNIVRGINHKRNYFASKYQIIDLEANVPMQ